VLALTRDNFSPADAETIAAQARPRPEIIHLQSADGAAVL
jgi:hypothetical protein